MRILITGGAGFIGSNSAAHFASQGNSVVIFDNLSRPGAQSNLSWLAQHHSISLTQGDISQAAQVEAVIRDQGPFDLILHLAAQVAVTTSVTDPRHDFMTNALGTLNLLEAVRLFNPTATLLYASTNKVYGGMPDLDIQERDGRYAYAAMPAGIDENRPLDFHSPYGCSKGAADQYCRDYHRIYGLKTIVLRQSCIYGYRQFGMEDQGWVAWFCIAAVLDKPITIYGDGKQVRDVLFIDDLINAFASAYAQRHRIAGEVFNIGGGPANTLSLLELLAQLEALKGQRLPIQFAAWRPGDQKVFVANCARAQHHLDWAPIINPRQGVAALYNWTLANRQLFS